MICPLCDHGVAPNMMTAHLIDVHEEFFPPASGGYTFFKRCVCGRAFISIYEHLSDVVGCETEADVVQHIFDGIMGRGRE